jgi:hypothetical protein
MPKGLPKAVAPMGLPKGLPKAVAVIVIALVRLL